RRPVRHLPDQKALRVLDRQPFVILDRWLLLPFQQEQTIASDCQLRGQAPNPGQVLAVSGKDAIAEFHLNAFAPEIHNKNIHIWPEYPDRSLLPIPGYPRVPRRMPTRMQLLIYYPIEDSPRHVLKALPKLL